MRARKDILRKGFGGALHFLVAGLVSAGAMTVLSGCLMLDQAFDDDDSDTFEVAPPLEPFPTGAPSPFGRSVPLGPVVRSEVRPRAISGGTLAVKGDVAVAAESDLDEVWIVGISGVARSDAEQTRIALEPGDEPGRVVIDDANRAHVALRRGGAVVSIDLAAREVVARRAVCGAPRGIAFEAASGELHVACAGGELVSLRASDLGQTGILRLGERDLRDVLVRGDRLLVSTFRRAELLEVRRDGAVRSVTRPPTFDPFGVRDLPPDVIASDRGVASFEPTTAWRTVQGPGGSVFMLHQRAQNETIRLESPGGYGGSFCESGIVHGTVTEVTEPGAEPGPGPVIAMAVLPVDAAVSPDGERIALAVPGNDGSGAQIFEVRRDDLAFNSECVFPEMQDGFGGFGDAGPGFPGAAPGQVVAVAYAQDGRLVAQTRAPAGLRVAGRTVLFAGAPNTRDSGHDIFHRNAGGFIACASCHAEGGDDAHVWRFEGIGPRRTQSMFGPMVGTEPFHWDGDMNDLGHLVGEVFVRRMGGLDPEPGHIEALAHFLDEIPTPPAGEPRNGAAVERGRELFHAEDVGCSTCHFGVGMTNNVNANVGTGGTFQVPRLSGIAWRAPFMHDGCAPDLRARFAGDRCGGGDRHGRTSHLSAAQIADLIAYLETL